MQSMHARTPHPSSQSRAENLGDIAQPVQALALVCQALNGPDWSLIEQNWDNSEDAAMDKPVSAIRPGWREIRSGTSAPLIPEPK